MPRMIDEWKSERQPPCVQFLNKVCYDSTRPLVQRDGPGEKRRRMAVVAKAEKNQIVLINWFTALDDDGGQFVFVLLRCDLRIYFAAHTHDRFLRDGRRHEKVFARHSEVALRIIRCHATLVSKSEPNSIPPKIMRLRRNPGVNGRWSVPA